MARRHLDLRQPNKARDSVDDLVSQVITSAMSWTTAALKWLRVEGANLVLKVTQAYGVTTERRCPACRCTAIRRSHRRNLLEKALSVVSILPFRCHDCGQRFWNLH